VANYNIQITWNDVSGETGYRLERRDENPNNWSVVASLLPNIVSYTDSGLIAGMQYFYRVRAFNTNGYSPYSNEASAVPANVVYIFQDDFDPDTDATLWASITGGVATNGSQGFRGSKALYFGGSGLRSAATIPLDISSGGNIEFFIRAGNEAVDGNTFWNNSEAGETVLLEYSKDGLNWSGFRTNNTVYPSLSSWTVFSVPIPSLANGPRTQFRWRQLANSGPAFDCWALEDIKIQAVAPLPPDPVPFVTSSPSSATSIAVFWVGADRAASYTVERKTGAGPWTILTNVPSAITYYTDSGLMPGTAYTYRITAANPGGTAAPSITSTTFTWTQIQQWVADNYGSPDALSQNEMIAPGADGIVPLLRFAFNLTANEPLHPLPAGGSAGYPTIWVDSTRNRLCVEYVRRKVSMNAGITYQVEFSGNLGNWTISNALVSTTPIDSMWERVRYEDLVLQTQAPARFCRVTVRPD